MALVLVPGSLAGRALLAAFWSLAFSGLPVAWSDWVAPF
ncbi:major facilitator superfamily MFS_1 [plant metagenome]